MNIIAIETASARFGRQHHDNKRYFEPENVSAFQIFGIAAH
jgi:hypothetical protein